MRGVIVYRSMYGATKQYAQWLSETLNIPVFETRDISADKLNEFDYVICGTPVYVGKLPISKWLRSFEETLSAKKLFIFIVCATHATDKSEVEKIISSNIDAKFRDNMKVFFLRGRMIKKSLSFFDNLILRMGASLQKNKSDKERMLTDFDDVKKENLKEIVGEIRSITDVAREITH